MPAFLAATKKLMDDAERAELVEYLAYNPPQAMWFPAPVVSEKSAGDWKVEANGAGRA